MSRNDYTGSGGRLGIPLENFEFHHANIEIGARSKASLRGWATRINFYIGALKKELA